MVSTCRYPVDYENGANAGLKETVLGIKELKAKHPNITFAGLCYVCFAG
jgi:hypothetical protein